MRVVDRGPRTTPGYERGTGRRAFARTVLALALGLAVSSGLVAQAEEPTEPVAGFRAEYLDDMAVLRRKVIGLAESLPDAVYAWRPTSEVRTTSEVFMHLAQTNVNIMRGLGREVPTDLSGELEKRVDKEPVIEVLKASFRHVRGTVLETTDEQLDEQVEFFGRSWSVRALLYLAATHMHEHLGQAIAYARSNGIAPPWSASARSESAAAGDGG